MATHKKSKAEAESSLIISRVQREAREGKGETGNTVIRSRVIHGADAVPTEPTRKAKRPRKTSTRTTKPKRHSTPDTSTEL